VRRFSVRREVALGLGVYALYLLVARRVLRRDGRARARRNAERIVAFERRTRLDVEPAVQGALLRYPRLVHGLNVGYGLFNVTLTVGWLALLYRRRDDGYHRFRRTWVRNRCSCSCRRRRHGFSTDSSTRCRR